MLQRFFAALRAHYGMTVFVLYLCAFGIAFVGTFTLPLISIFMVLLSIFLLVPAVLLGDAIGALSRRTTRPYLRRGVCPQCREQQGPAWEPPVFRCAFCQAAFDPTGDPHEPDDLAARPQGQANLATNDAG